MPQYLTLNECIAITRSIMAEASEMLTQQAVFLRDTNYSLQRLKQPSRSLYCNHLQCFDYHSYLAFNTLRLQSEYICPVCGVGANPTKVYCDVLWLTIINIFRGEDQVYCGIDDTITAAPKAPCSGNQISVVDLTVGSAYLAGSNSGARSIKCISFKEILLNQEYSKYLVSDLGGMNAIELMEMIVPSLLDFLHFVNSDEKLERANSIDKMYKERLRIGRPFICSDWLSFNQDLIIKAHFSVSTVKQIFRAIADEELKNNDCIKMRFMTFYTRPGEDLGNTDAHQQHSHSQVSNAKCPASKKVKRGPTHAPSLPSAPKPLPDVACVALQSSISSLPTPNSSSSAASNELANQETLPHLLSISAFTNVSPAACRRKPRKIPFEDGDKLFSFSKPCLRTVQASLQSAHISESREKDIHRKVCVNVNQVPTESSAAETVGNGEANCADVDLNVSIDAALTLNFSSSNSVRIQEFEGLCNFPSTATDSADTLFVSINNASGDYRDAPVPAPHQPLRDTAAVHSAASCGSFAALYGSSALWSGSSLLPHVQHTPNNSNYVRPPVRRLDPTPKVRAHSKLGSGSSPRHRLDSRHNNSHTIKPRTVMHPKALPRSQPTKKASTGKETDQHGNRSMPSITQLLVEDFVK